MSTLISSKKNSNNVKKSKRKIDNSEKNQKIIRNEGLFSENINNRLERQPETMLIPLIKKFIFILKKPTAFFKFKSLSENAFSLINDQSYYRPNKKNNAKVKILK